MFQRYRPALLIWIGGAALLISALTIGLSVYNSMLINDLNYAAYQQIRAQIEKLEAQEQAWLDQACPVFLYVGTSVDTWTAEKCIAWESATSSKHQQPEDNQ